MQTSAAKHDPLAIVQRRLLCANIISRFAQFALPYIRMRIYSFSIRDNQKVSNILHLIKLTFSFFILD